jgi:hypothetical protein
MERKRAQNAEDKQKDRQEGEEYRRLAEQYALEHMEVERFRKLTQKEVKNMYDKALEDRAKVKQMETQMDEVTKESHFILIFDFHI